MHCWNRSDLSSKQLACQQPSLHRVGKTDGHSSQKRKRSRKYGSHVGPCHSFAYPWSSGSLCAYSELLMYPGETRDSPGQPWACFVVKVGLKLQSSHLSFLRAGIIGMYHHVQWLNFTVYKLSINSLIDYYVKIAWQVLWSRKMTDPFYSQLSMQISYLEH
jgi:hypothetical protein